jgi:hypothetical protein
MMIRWFMIIIPKIKIIIFFLTVMSLTIALSGCIDNSEQPVTPVSTTQSTGSEENLPPLLNITVMKSILPDDLPGEWEYLQNYSSEGTVTTLVSKPGNHRSVITIQDKRTEQLAKYAVTPENFSYSQSSIKWELSEAKHDNADAMIGTNIENGISKGELIAYPHDRFLVIAYIVGENDKIVKIIDLLDSLEFP